MKSARAVADSTDSFNTFNGWSDQQTGRIIDYIYFKGFGGCPEYQTVRRQYLDIPFVSDHYPITARLIFPELD
jgi:endonuclease/exonuclease/phosphatase family metal-dependent hydrolase